MTPSRFSRPKSVLRQVVALFRRRLDPIGYARSIGVTVGEHCRLINVTYSTEPYLIHLGDHVSATKTHFETHDGGVWVLRDANPDIDIVRPIYVGDNVYFGYGCIVLPGVRIGSNVIVGAGSIVTRDIPDGSVCVGVPARVIRKVEEYSATALASGSPTKMLNPQEKRAFYLREYGNQN